jgi:hypothetical protein
MKNVFYMALLSLLVATVVTACSEDDDDSSGDTLTNTINAKWEISNPNSAYASFEFSKDGDYIVLENEKGATLKSSARLYPQNSLFQNKTKVSTRSSSSDSNLSPIHFGKYKIEGNKIILLGFGSIDIISITAEEFTFSFTLEATGKKEEYIANKAEEPVSSSSRTSMLCRTWLLEKVTIDESSVFEEDKAYYLEKYGNNWKTEIEKMRNEDIAGSTVLFSKAGTYLVLYVGKDEAGLSEWRWANEEETALYYSWENWENNWRDNIVQIKELNNTILKMQEEESVFHLVPEK